MTPSFPGEESTEQEPQASAPASLLVREGAAISNG